MPKDFIRASFLLRQKKKKKLVQCFIQLSLRMYNLCSLRAFSTFFYLSNNQEAGVATFGVHVLFFLSSFFLSSLKSSPGNQLYSLGRDFGVMFLFSFTEKILEAFTWVDWKVYFSWINKTCWEFLSENKKIKNTGIYKYFMVLVWRW